MNNLSLAFYEVLKYAMDKHLEDINFLGMVGLSSSRRNDKHPNYGKIEIVFPDEWVRNATGDERFADAYFVCKISRYIVDEWRKVRELSDKTETETLGSLSDTVQSQPSSEDILDPNNLHSSTSFTDLEQNDIQ